MRAQPVLDGREPAGLERRTDARHQLLGDLGWEQIADRRADDDVRRIREARDVTRDLEVGAVRPQPQQQVGKSVEQRLEARLDRRGDPVHAFIVDGVRRSERYVEAMAQPRKKSLQDVLRERRAAAPLLSARELREREAARRREEVEREAARLVARWRAERTAVDADGKLSPADLRGGLRVEPARVPREQALVAPLVGAAQGDAGLRGRPVREVRGAACPPRQPRRARRGARRRPGHALRALPAPSREARAGARPPGDAGGAPGARSRAAALRRRRDRRAEGEAQPSTRAVASPAALCAGDSLALERISVVPRAVAAAVDHTDQVRRDAEAAVPVRGVAGDRVERAVVRDFGRRSPDRRRLLRFVTLPTIEAVAVVDDDAGAHRCRSPRFGASAPFDRVREMPATRVVEMPRSRRPRRRRSEVGCRSCSSRSDSPRSRRRRRTCRGRQMPAPVRSASVLPAIRLEAAPKATMPSPESRTLLSRIWFESVPLSVRTQPDARHRPSDDELLDRRAGRVEQLDALGEVGDLAVLHRDAGPIGDVDPDSCPVCQPLDRVAVQVDRHVVCSDNEAGRAAFQRLA